MTIASVSKRYGLSQDTLRYYERVGLIPSVRKNKSGHRDYSEYDLKWIEFTKCMRAAGLPIEALIEYFSLFSQGDATLDARKALLIRQREELLKKMADMQTTLTRLDKKIERYERGLMKSEYFAMPEQAAP